MTTFNSPRIGLIAILLLTSLSSAVAQQAQTPWQSNASGWQLTNLIWPNYNAGYHFTPQVDGQVDQLGGFYNGTKVVRLYDVESGDILATAQVTAANDWSYMPIVPVDVVAGRHYAVAVTTGFRGASMYFGPGFPMFPQTYDDITIERSVWGLGRSLPTYELVNQMWGQADIRFVPAAQSITVEGEFPPSPLWINAMPGPEPLPITTADVFLNVTNNGSESITYEFNSSQRFDIFVIDSNGDVVSSWSRGAIFLQVLGTETVAPGETYRVGGAVELSHEDGSPLEPGDYTLKIMLTSEPTETAPSAMQAVQIQWAF